MQTIVYSDRVEATHVSLQYISSFFTAEEDLISEKLISVDGFGFLESSLKVIIRVGSRVF